MSIARPKSLLLMHRRVGDVRWDEAGRRGEYAFAHGVEHLLAGGARTAACERLADSEYFSRCHRDEDQHFRLASHWRALPEFDPGTHIRVPAGDAGASVLYAVGDILSMCDRDADALVCFDAALACWESTGVARADIARAHHYRGSCLWSLGRNQEAHAALQRALHGKVLAFGREHPETAETLTALGLLARSERRLEEAAELLEEALRVALDTLGQMHPDTAICHHNMGLLRESQGDRTSAVSEYARALDIKEGRYGPDHVALAATLASLGELEWQRDPMRAEQWMRRSIRISELWYGDASSTAVRTRVTLLLLLDRAGRPAEAEHELTLLIAASRRAVREQRVAAWVWLKAAAFVAAQRGRHTEAIPIYESVVALQERHGADKPDDLLHSLWHLSRSLEATEQWGELVCVQERLLAVRARQHGEVSAETASDAHRLGATLLRLGRLPEAEAAFQRCLWIEEQVYGPERGELDMTLYRLGEVHIRQGTHHCALPILERCLRIEIRDQPEAASTGLTMELVALCLSVAGDEHAAQALLLRGLRLVERELGAENYRVLRMRARLVLMGAG